MLGKMVHYFNREVAKFEKDIEEGRLSPQEHFDNASMRCLGVASFCLANGVSLVEVLKAYDDTMEQMRGLFNMSNKNRKG